MKTIRLSTSNSDIQQAAKLLCSGELVAFPTETVYGLGASILQPQAITAIYTVKGRAKDNPLIAHISDRSQLSLLTDEVSDMAHILMDAFFPGPLTIVFPKHPTLSPVVTSGLETIAVRMPSHPVAHALIAACRVPLVAPSANLSGHPSPTTAQHVLQDLDTRIAAVIDGGTCTVGIESTVLDITQNPIILRPGIITKEEIEHVIKTPVASIVGAIDTEAPVASPGMKYRHYAPNAPVVVLKSLPLLEEELQKNPYKQSMVITNQQLSPSLPVSFVRPLTEYDLYANFREANTLGVDRIYILLDSDIQKHVGLMNRIEKASQT